MRARTLAVLSLFSLLAAPLPAQVVHGKLVDVGTGAAVTGARVQLLRGERAADTTMTDTAGMFTLRSDDGGKFRLAAERLGYAASVSAEVEIGERDSLEVLFRIAPSTVVLEPLEVVATVRRRGPRLEAFYERAERDRFGHFITREQIERRRPAYATDLLRQAPGLRIAPARRIGYAVRGRGGCLPVVVIDGMKLGVASSLVDEWVRPDDIEGIEIYSAVGTAPAEFSMYENGCAMIVIWTREQ